MRDISHLLDNFEENPGSDETITPQESLYDIINERNSNEFSTDDQFIEHSNKIRNHIIDELKSKKRLRIISYWVIVGFAITLMGATWTFLFRFSEDTPLALLITVTVASFGNMLSLIAIIFKYVFSSTTEITDYAKILLESENNGNGN